MLYQLLSTSWQISSSTWDSWTFSYLWSFLFMISLLLLSVSILSQTLGKYHKLSTSSNYIIIDENGYRTNRNGHIKPNKVFLFTFNFDSVSLFPPGKMPSEDVDRIYFINVLIHGKSTFKCGKYWVPDIRSISNYFAVRHIDDKMTTTTTLNASKILQSYSKQILHTRNYFRYIIIFDLLALQSIIIKFEDLNKLRTLNTYHKIDWFKYFHIYFANIPNNSTN